jgi:hypothetical protein
MSNLISGCFIVDFLLGDICGNKSSQQSISPNRKYVASTVVRNCGATTDYVTFLFLRKTQDPEIDIKNAQNIPRVATLNNGNQINLIWSSDKALTVKYGSLELLDHLSQWNGVEIKYQQ